MDVNVCICTYEDVCLSSSSICLPVSFSLFLELLERFASSIPSFSSQSITTVGALAFCTSSHASVGVYRQQQHRHHRFFLIECEAPSRCWGRRGEASLREREEILLSLLCLFSVRPGGCWREEERLFLPFLSFLGCAVLYLHFIKVSFCFTSKEESVRRRLLSGSLLASFFFLFAFLCHHGILSFFLVVLPLFFSLPSRAVRLHAQLLWMTANSILATSETGEERKRKADLLPVFSYLPILIFRSLIYLISSSFSSGFFWKVDRSLLASLFCPSLSFLWP